MALVHAPGFSELRAAMVHVEVAWADAAAVQAYFARIGAFDHLMFTAGETLQLGPLADTDLEKARQFFNLPFWGAYIAAKYASGRTGGNR